MNTMEITKVVGGLAGALLILLLLKFGAETYYFPHGEHGEAAYKIEVADAGPVEEVEVIPFADLVAAANADSGARVFNKCKSCHSNEAGENKVGPSLFGIVDRTQAAEDGFSYSGAMSALSGAWTLDDLNEFLIKPSDYLPGTAMSFGGLPKEKDRANLVAYLATLQ